MDYDRLEEETDPGMAVAQSKGQIEDPPVPPPYEHSLGPLPPMEGPPLPSGPPPVMAQPQPTGQPAIVGPQNVQVLPAVQSTVIVNQMQDYGLAYPQNIREWSTNLCSCFDNMGICLYGCFCHWCQICSVASRMNESGCGVACCVPGGLIALRAKYRTMYGIRGDICTDCCVMCWCEPCAVCQMAREQSIRPY